MFDHKSVDLSVFVSDSVCLSLSHSLSLYLKYGGKKVSLWNIKLSTLNSRDPRFNVQLSNSLNLLLNWEPRNEVLYHEIMIDYITVNSR